MNMLKRCLISLLTLPVLLGSILCVRAAGNVSYSGDAGQFVFAPGSQQSISDLFSDFKEVMPGDTLTQTITVRNNASDKVNVKVYLRSLGANEDSKDFLSQLTLKVTAGENSLFEASADQTAQLADWVLLGTLHSGGTADLDVTLQVPVTLDNAYMSQTGLLDWQFMVEETPDQPVDPDTPVDPDEPDVPDVPVDPDEPDVPDVPDDPAKPDVPKTGDAVRVDLFMALFAGTGILVLLLMAILLKRRKRSEGN